MINPKEVSRAWIELVSPSEPCPAKVVQMAFARPGLDGSSSVVIQFEPSAEVKVLREGFRPAKALAFCRVGFHCIPQVVDATLIPMDPCNYYTTTDAECLKLGGIEIYSRASESDTGEAIRLRSANHVEAPNDAVIGVNNRLTIHRRHVGRYIEAWVRYQPIIATPILVNQNVKLHLILSRDNSYWHQEVTGCGIDTGAEELLAYQLKLTFSQKNISEATNLSRS